MSGVVSPKQAARRIIAQISRKCYQFITSRLTRLKLGVHKVIHTDASRKMMALLKRLRKQAGLSQKILASRLGVVRQVVGKIEMGERQLLVLELKEYLGAIGGITPVEFMVMLEEELRKGEDDIL